MPLRFAVCAHIINEPAKSGHGGNLPLKRVHANIDQSFIEQRHFLFVNFISTQVQCSGVDPMIVLVACRVELLIVD